MAGANNSFTQKRYAIVTGSSRGIGFEICKQLASNGVTVVVTARDEKKGAEAVEKLNNLGLRDCVVFHQLDVTNSSSIASLVDFIRTRFGMIDILVNNAAIVVGPLDWDAIQAFVVNAMKDDTLRKLGNTMKCPDEAPEECWQTNYYGAKRMVEAFIPLLQLSGSPRIVNVSSSVGKLKNIHSEEVRRVLNNAESLDEETVDEVLKDFLKDFKEGSLESKGCWPTFLPAYAMSKVALNAYTRILAKKYPNFRINCICPGYVKTDMSNNTGFYTAHQAAEGIVKLALLPDDGPSGLFFEQSEVSSFC